MNVVVKRVKKIKVRQYYISDYLDKKDMSNIDNLTKKFEQMSLNLVDILITLEEKTRKESE